MRALKRFWWRLRLLKDGIPWWASRYIDNRPPTDDEIRRGMEIARELGLVEKDKEPPCSA